MATIVPGTRFGPYEIVSFIAAGGMGEVYRGYDARLERAVAVKTLPEACFGDSEAVLRFEREARAAAAVSHPNLVSIFDVGQTEGLHYLVMELLEGETLRQRLASGALPWTDAVRFTVAIAEGLGAVHAKGLVHRDLKPENIFVTANGWVKLLDFGLAILGPPLGEPSADDPTIKALTRKGTWMGTLAYMSPEQLRQETLDGRADIFAIGSVLYEMLAGSAAFRRSSNAEMIAAILTEGDVTVPGSLPGDLGQIVRRCLQRPRERRFQSAADLAFALRLVADARPLPEASPAADDGPSIAVLPFANLSGDQENAYFSDGLSEEILTELTRVPGLKVTARTSAFAFRGKSQDIRRIGEALGVRTILEGSVRRMGDQMRVTAQLVDATNGYQLWSARYDRAMTDVFAVQDEIAAAIVDTLKLRLVSGKPVPHTANVRSFHAYLKSRYYFAKFTAESVGRGLVYAEEAVALDPGYAAAQAGLAECFMHSAVFCLRPSRELIPPARAAALNALALGSTEASAHMTLARIAGEFDLDWTEALRRCRSALACDHVSPSIRGLCAQWLLFPLGRADEAIAAIRPALQDDPLSAMPRFVQALAHYGAGSRERALEELGELLEVHERFYPAHEVRGCIYAGEGRTRDAIATLETSLPVAPWGALTMGLLAGNYLRAGDRPRAERMLAGLEGRAFGMPSEVALTAFHIIGGDYSSVVHHLEAMLEARYPLTAYYFGVFSSLFEEFRHSEPAAAFRRTLKLDEVVSP